MSTVRQYIGARYVIKIYENSQDPSSAEWEQGNFDPLVMVTWQNGSYLSKKEVPASVGNPASNPDYWVQTGFYNGQIASLQNQIDQINTNIGNISTLDTSATDLVSAINEILHTSSSIANRRFIFVGDSYAAGTLPSTWYSTVLSCLGLTDNTNAYLVAQDGAGFVNGYFTSLLSGLTVSDPDKITDIIVAGGMNDDQQTESDILNAIQSFITAAKTTYPNANISIASIGWRESVTQNVMELHVINTYKKCINYGAKYLNGVEWALHRYDMFESGYTNHPNSDGNAAIGRAISTAILTGSYDPTSERRELNATFNVTPAAQSVGTTKVITQISGGCAELVLQSYSGRHFAFTIDSDVTVAPASPLLLYTLPNDTYFKGYPDIFRTIATNLVDATDGTIIPAKVAILGFGVYLTTYKSVSLNHEHTFTISCESFVAPLGDC